jgi:uncharacterized protein (TIRG00374 family)
MESESTQSAEFAQMPSPLRRWLYLIIGLLIGGTFLYLAARNVNFDEAWAAIYSIHSIWLLPYVILYLLSMFIRSARWRLMFPDDSRPSLRHAIDGYLIGKAGNSLMPGRLGEVVRAGVVGKRYPGVGISGTLATIMVEKILDSVTILLLLGLVLLSVPLPSWVANVGLTLITVFSILILVLWFMVRADSRNMYTSTATSAGAVARVKNFVLRLLKKFSTGLHAFRSMEHFFLPGVLTILVWGTEIILMYIIMQAFSIPAPFMASVVSIVFLCIGGMIPAAPGYIGSYQLVLVTAMQLYAIPESSSFALAVFLNLYVIVMTLTLGLIAVFYEGGLVNFRQLFASPTKKV